MNEIEKTEHLNVPQENIHGPANGHVPSMANTKDVSGNPIDARVQSFQEEKANAWHKQSQPYKIPRPNRKGKRKNESLLAVLCQWIVDHQIGIAINLLMLLALTHLSFPRARRHTRKFFQLSYYNSSSGRYTIGWDDLPLVFYWIVVFTGLRAAVLDYILEPLAGMAGIDKKKDKVRFAEQAWIITYDSAFWSLGMYIMYNSEYWFNFRGLWTNWPTRELDGVFKWYYLVQFAFWLQQMIVVNIEERRKDYAQMFTHHIITSTLIFTSYGYHMHKVGNIILCLMDIADILLPIAKILKYLDIQPACDIAFSTFMAVWLMTRHVGYFLVLWSIQTEAPNIIKYGCYWGPNSNLQGPIEPPDQLGHLIQPFLDPEGLVCWSTNIARYFMVTLVSLQVILLLWFAMIIRVAVKVIRGGGAEDSRSDDEEPGEEAEPDQKSHYKNEIYVTNSPSHEEAVSVQATPYRRSSPPKRFRKGAGVASGVTIPSDRKELLGRIGCDKGA